MIDKAVTFNQKGFTGIQSALLVGAITSGALVGGIALASSSASAVNTGYGSEICVKAERLDNPKISTFRGDCATDDPVPSAEPTINPTTSPEPEVTPSATATPTEPAVVTPSPTPTPPPIDKTIVGATAPVKDIRDTAADVTGALSIVTSVDGTMIAAHSTKKAWISDNAGQSWKLVMDISTSLGGVSKYLSAMTTTRDATTVTMTPGNEGNGSMLALYKFDLSKMAIKGFGTSFLDSGDVATFLSATSSDNGYKMTALRSDGYVWTSTNLGSKWVKGQYVGSSNFGGVNKLAASNDGTKLVAVGKNAVWNSTDSGKTWVNLKQTGRTYTSIDANADGSKWVATAANGNLFYSTDMGATWTAYEALGTSVNWGSVSMSDDGQVIVVGKASLNGEVYFSKDGGDTWNTSTDMGKSVWGISKISPDGKRFFIQSSSRMKTGIIE